MLRMERNGLLSLPPKLRPLASPDSTATTLATSGARHLSEGVGNALTYL